MRVMLSIELMSFVLNVFILANSLDTQEMRYEIKITCTKWFRVD